MLQGEKLKDYFSVLYQQERELYFQNRVCQNIREKMASLGRPRDIQKPTLVLPKEEKAGVTLLTIFGGGVFGAIAGFVIWFLLGLYFVDGRGMKLDDYTEKLNWPAFTVIGAVVVFILAIILTIFNKIAEENAAHDKFHKELQEYEAAVRADQERVRQELREGELLRQQLAEMEAVQLQSRKVLDTLYARDICFPKYRNLVAVSSIYEYLCSGRCSVLEGHEGAYNIFETEYRLDKILVGMDKILASLNQIKQNQFMLHSAITESNRRSDQILEQTQNMANQISRYVSDVNNQMSNMNNALDEMNRNSSIAAYHAEQASRELEFMNRMKYWAGEYDAAAPYNTPPARY